MKTKLQIEILIRALYIALIVDSSSSFGLSEILDETTDASLKDDKNYLEFKKELLELLDSLSE